MKSVSILSATSVYKAASEGEITRHLLDHAGLADVSRSLRSLVQSLDSESEEEFWQKVLIPARRLAFAFCSTPLPFDRAAAAACIDWNKLHRQVRSCQKVYPDSHAALASIVQNLQSLSAETGSPFTALLESLHAQSGNLSVILRNSRMNRAVAEYFAASTALRNATVVSSRQLREVHKCNVLVAIGPCGWFPDYVFSAPRAAQIHAISYRWMRDQWKPGPVFLNGSGSVDKTCKHCIGALPRLRDQTVPTTQTLPDLQPVDLIPPLPPFGKTVSRFEKRQPVAGEEIVPARLCYLSGGRAVFVSADEDASALVIDSSETGDSAVNRVPAHELEPELYLLLRTLGGGDLIVPLADRILGSQAAERRFQQAEWKDQLVAAAQERFGGSLTHRELASRVSDYLRSQSLSESSYTKVQNVRNWMSSKTIRPSKEEDFAAILAFAGMADRIQELWEAMGEIRRAHQKAGKEIKEMLLQKIASSSLELLERDGEMDFDLGEQGGGTLSAFQIMDISEEEFEIPADRIGILLDLEE